MTDVRCSCGTKIRLKGRHPGRFAMVRVTCPRCRTSFVGRVQTGKLADNPEAGSIGESFDDVMREVRDVLKKVRG